MEGVAAARFIVAGHRMAPASAVKIPERVRGPHTTTTMITEDRLIGWLCILRNQFDKNIRASLMIPDVVSAELAKRGWLELQTEEDWEGLHDALFTDEGKRVSDLNAAEWGIDALS